MLIEIHMIQNHSPANLNRDDLGAPKTCIFGGATRARISSQCLKRSIRRSDEFAAALEKAGGVRTRRLADLLARIAYAGDFDLVPRELIELFKERPSKDERLRELEKLAAEALQLGGVKPKKKGKGKKKEKAKSEDDVDVEADDDDDDDDDDEEKKAEELSKMLLFLSTDTIKEMAKDLKEATDSKKLAEKFKQYIAEKPSVPDIALNGRMTEVAKNSLFSDLNFTVEAALSAGHALSTHAVVNEVDYFTAADDIPGQDAGAAHVNEALFNSACFYKHFVIDFEQLRENLGGDTDLACTTVRSFLDAAAKAHPSGKQHSFAAFNPPEGILVEVKSKTATPVSYANAFADPVPEGSQPGLIRDSIDRLGQYVGDLVEGYGIEAERFWFSPNRRHRLAWVDKGLKEHEQVRPVVGDSNEFGQFGELLDRVMKEVEEAASDGEAAK